MELSFIFTRKFVIRWFVEMLEIGFRCLLNVVNLSLVM